MLKNKNNYMDNLSFSIESDSLSKNSEICIAEFQKLKNFFNIFITTHKEEVESFQKQLETLKSQSTIHPSILLSNLLGIYSFYKNINKSIIGI